VANGVHMTSKPKLLAAAKARRASVLASSSKKEQQPLLYFRLKNGWTLRELSDITGISPATLCRMERGVGRASPRSIIKMHQTLSLSMQQIQKLVGNRKPRRS